VKEPPCATVVEGVGWVVMTGLVKAEPLLDEEEEDDELEDELDELLLLDPPDELDELELEVPDELLAPLEELDEDDEELDEDDELDELEDELELLLDEVVTDTKTAEEAAPRRLLLSVAFAVML